MDKDINSRRSNRISRGLLAAASDPCVKVAGLQFVDPADAIACQKSFPFNETIRQNVLSVVSRESTTNIRADIARINSTRYATDYDFNGDLWDFTTQLNDGHTRWFPNCYNSYQNILPAPVVILDDGIFIAPDSVELLNQLGPNFISFFAAKGFNWQRLAGARVLTIGGLPASVYVDQIARTVSGNFLDHNVRVNSVISSYRIVGTSFSQRVGDLAGPIFLKQTSLKFLLIPANSKSPELVDIPSWANNCAATPQTNGVDLKSGVRPFARGQPRLARAVLNDPAAQPKTAIGLPPPFLPTLSPTNGSTGVIKSYILPGNKTGVVRVLSHSPSNFNQFPLDVEAAVNQFKKAGVTNLVIDVTNNGGGFVCLGLFLHQFLAGTEAGFPGFQSTSRANTLAQKILKADISLGLDGSVSFYTADNWQFLNGTQMPVNFNYNDPSVPFVVNGRSNPTSQRFEDVCPTPQVNIPATPPFDLNHQKLLFTVGNGNCASTCALFTTVMFERHQTKIATFGGNPFQPIQYKGMAGNQVLEWTDLDTEIKTAGLKDDPLAPPDFCLPAYSFFDENKPIAYVSEQPQFRFPYTAETYNNPQKVWAFV
ncbi:hypothetical protein B0F90DRAFT_1810686 [Multifurca ochricompacta]|uniref:Tail specific protease domain-containing protein n=1 Tax=Multifurca ochricompacta TaxID=376703 RepID=A0AAD4M4R9_9AGAM|nr:hypothetical protein B0F90DRAFT_1810686 [Multifurca ochricompacta]